MGIRICLSLQSSGEQDKMHFFTNEGILKEKKKKGYINYKYILIIHATNLKFCPESVHLNPQFRMSTRKAEWS